MATVQNSTLKASDLTGKREISDRFMDSSGDIGMLNTQIEMQIIREKESINLRG